MRSVHRHPAFYTRNLLHGFAPGRKTDVIARLLAGELAKGLGQATVFDPEPGAGGNVWHGVAATLGTLQNPFDPVNGH